MYIYNLLYNVNERFVEYMYSNNVEFKDLHQA